MTVSSTLKTRFCQRILGIHGSAYWPMHPSSQLSYPHRVLLGRGTAPGALPFCYVSAHVGLIVGDGVQFGERVGLITANHDPGKIDNFLDAPPQIIGDYCVIEDGVVILPGVEIAAHCIVTAGSVVTKSCLTPWSIISGSPAKAVGTHDRALPPVAPNAGHGYIDRTDFDAFRRRNLREEFFGRFSLNPPSQA